MINYLLLLLAVFQLPFLLYLSNVHLPELWTLVKAHLPPPQAVQAGIPGAVQAGIPGGVVGAAGKAAGM